MNVQIQSGKVINVQIQSGKVINVVQTDHPPHPQLPS